MAGKDFEGLSKLKSEEIIWQINQIFRTTLGVNSAITVNPVDQGLHIAKFINKQENDESRVFNIISVLPILQNLPDAPSAVEIWDELLANDPNAPSDPRHYNVTFVDEDFPYMEWRWLGGQIVENRFAFFGGRPKNFEWKRLKTAELYDHRKHKSPLWEWLDPIGFALSAGDIERLDNFVPGEEILVFTSTGPSTIGE